MREDESGYIVVETIGTFIPFVLLVVAILSLVNIVTLQSRVHYALTQAANTLSVYSYVLEVTGTADILAQNSNIAGSVTDGADEMKADINAVIDGIESLSAGDVRMHGEAAVNRAIGWGENIADDPKTALQVVLNYGIEQARGKLFEELIRPLIGRYLANGEKTGNEYLESVNVIGGLKGLDFYDFDLLELDSTGENDSVLIDENGDIKLVVQYEVKYKFGILPIPFEDAKLRITQTAKTKA